MVSTLCLHTLLLLFDILVDFIECSVDSFNSPQRTIICIRRQQTHEKNPYDFEYGKLWFVQKSKPVRIHKLINAIFGRAPFGLDDK